MSLSALIFVQLPKPLSLHYRILNLSNDLSDYVSHATKSGSANTTRDPYPLGNGFATLRVAIKAIVTITMLQYNTFLNFKFINSCITNIRYCNCFM